MVELKTINKVLLRRQPKHLNHFVHQFVCFQFARFDFACFNLYLLPCSKVAKFLQRRRNTMESLVQALGRSRAESKEFSTIRKVFFFFCKKKQILVDGLGNVATLKKFLSGKSRRWTQRRDVEKPAFLERRDVASERHDVGSHTCWNVATLDTTSRRS